MDKDTRIDAWLFVAYEMYYRGKTKEELDNIGAFELIMDQDDFRYWKANGMPDK